MTVKQVHALLGEPEKSKTDAEGTREYYGDAAGHGEVNWGLLTQTGDVEQQNFLLQFGEPLCVLFLSLNSHSCVAGLPVFQSAGANGVILTQ